MIFLRRRKKPCHRPLLLLRPPCVDQTDTQPHTGTSILHHDGSPNVRRGGGPAGTGRPRGQPTRRTGSRRTGGDRGTCQRRLAPVGVGRPSVVLQGHLLLDQTSSQAESSARVTQESATSPIEWWSFGSVEEPNQTLRGATDPCSTPPRRPSRWRRASRAGHGGTSFPRSTRTLLHRCQAINGFACPTRGQVACTSCPAGTCCITRTETSTRGGGSIRGLSTNATSRPKSSVSWRRCPWPTWPVAWRRSPRVSWRTIRMRPSGSPIGNAS